MCWWRDHHHYHEQYERKEEEENTSNLFGCQEQNYQIFAAFITPPGSLSRLLMACSSAFDWGSTLKFSSGEIGPFIPQRRLTGAPEGRQPAVVSWGNAQVLLGFSRFLPIPSQLPDCPPKRQTLWMVLEVLAYDTCFFVSLYNIKRRQTDLVVLGDRL